LQGQTTFGIYNEVYGKVYGEWFLEKSVWF